MVMPISLAFRRAVLSLLCFGLGCLAPQAFAQTTFAPGAVTTDKLQDAVLGDPDAGGVQAADIDGDAIIDSAFFADNSVGSDEIEDGSLTNNRLGVARGGGSGVPDFEGITNYWSVRHIKDETIQSNAIKDGMVDSDAFFKRLVLVNGEMVDGSAVTSTKVVGDAVRKEQLANGAVGLEHLATGAGPMGDSLRARVDKRIADTAMSGVGVNEDHSVDDTPTTAEYQEQSLRQQADYWADRVGLDPAEGPSGTGDVDADASLTAKINFVVGVADNFAVQRAEFGDDDTTRSTSTVITDANAATEYDSATADRAANYWAERIGLNPGVDGNADGSIAEKVKYTQDQLGDAGSEFTYTSGHNANTESITSAKYEDGNLEQKADYLNDRLGLDPDVAGAVTVNSNLQQRLNAVDEFLGDFTANPLPDPIDSASDLSAIETDYDDDASISAQQKYLAGLIGLNPAPAVGNRDGNLQQRVKAALDELGLPGNTVTSTPLSTDVSSTYGTTSLYAKANYWVSVIGLDPNQREADEAVAVAGNLSVRTNWDIDEIGDSDDTVRHNSENRELTDQEIWTKDVSKTGEESAYTDAYGDARSFYARDNYWARRLGLKPSAAADYDGSLQGRLNWLKQEVGQRLDVIANFAGAASYTNELPVATYRSSNLRSQSNYWADRVGLDPYAIPDINGNIQSQINHLINEADRLTRSIAMAAALRDVYVPAGGKGGASFTFADYHGEFGFAMSLASLVGPRSKFTLSLGSTGDQEEATVRLGYDIAW